LHVIKQKEVLYEQHTKGIRDKLEKRFTREREFNKKFAEEKEYASMQYIDKAVKHSAHLTKKHKLEGDFLRTLKDEESKSLIKI
jgi:hypothetical protein